MLHNLPLVPTCASCSVHGGSRSELRHDGGGVRQILTPVEGVAGRPAPWAGPQLSGDKGCREGRFSRYFSFVL